MSYCPDERDEVIYETQVLFAVRDEWSVKVYTGDKKHFVGVARRDATNTDIELIGLAYGNGRQDGATDAWDRASTMVHKSLRSVGL